MSIPSGVILAAAIIAQTAAAEPALNPNWWQPIAQTGALGGMLLWFMFVQTRSMREHTQAINLMAQILSAAVLESKHKDTAISELMTNLNQQAKEALHDSSKRKTPLG